MSLFDASLAPRPSLASLLARLFETPFDRRSRALRGEVEALRSLSDQELAQRGLTRETIVLHVFGAPKRC